MFVDGDSSDAGELIVIIPTALFWRTDRGLAIHSVVVIWSPGQRDDAGGRRGAGLALDE